MTLTSSGIVDPPVPSPDQLQSLARQAREQRLTGRIARIVEIGRVAVEEEPVRPAADGEVLVLTLLSGISAGTELSMLRGTNPYLHKRWDERLRLFVTADGTPQRAFPLDFGYEAVGVCAWSLHPHVREGDVVYGNWGHREWVTLKGQHYRSQLLPRALTIRDGIYPGQMGPIALNGVLHAAGRHQDATAVVFGAGVVGLLVAQIARADGAARVIVVDRLPYRLQAATKLGFETLDAAAHDDVARTLKEWAGGVPVAFECSGAYPALAEAIRCVANRGMVVALGFYQGDGAALRLGEEFHHNRVRLICAQIGALPEHLRRRDAEFAAAGLSDEVLRLAVAGQIRLGDLVSHIVPVEQSGEALDLAMGRPNEALQVALSYPIEA